MESMESLAVLESFVRSAECGGFSAAARLLALSPAAVSRNVAQLEQRLGVQLFHRSTRRLELTEAGQRFFSSIGGPLEALQASIAQANAAGPAGGGVLKVSLAPAFGRAYVLPLLPEFRSRWPQLQLQWHFEERAVDLQAEGYDVALGVGLHESSAVAVRVLAPAHLVAVSAPAYMAGRAMPSDPSRMAGLEGIVQLSKATGRVARWSMRQASGAEQPALLSESLVFDDAAAVREACLLGLGVALLPMADVLLPLQRGELLRLLPGWWADAGSIAVACPAHVPQQGKVRAFVDFIVERFQQHGLAARLDAGRS
jgi:DNA-binding transcriptional LysR family regulator